MTDIMIVEEGCTFTDTESWPRWIRTQAQSLGSTGKYSCTSCFGNAGGWDEDEAGCIICLHLPALPGRPGITRLFKPVPSPGEKVTAR